MAKVIMIQGTASNVGKSLICAGLCRIFAKDGYKVAPFKSQNMALNSAITADGLEMGRAQVVQAEAAGVAPTVHMNPILLKPTGATGSQVIVHGISQGTMPAKEYFSCKKQLIPKVMGSFHQLSEEYDIIVIEGAGSPAEINLRADDFVNMGLAEMVDAPVILVGDIARGGVFASLYGTVALLEKSEQNRIVGLIINQFRGDLDILRPGLTPLEEMTGKPVLGVIPMMDVDIDDEDSLSSRLHNGNSVGLVDIAVIRLPQLSNFTDFSPLERQEAVTLRYVTQVKQLRNPDLIILPGTKHTINDLIWLKESGLSNKIEAHAQEGGAVIGICGGYQMLCDAVTDPLGVEGGTPSVGVEGLGLLPGVTEFFPEKTRSQVTGNFQNMCGIFSSLSGLSMEGYEIHMGETSCKSENILNITDNNGTIKADGMASGNLWGCYVHGIFDRGEVCAGVVNALLDAKGLPAETASQDRATYAQAQYDKLADVLRSSVDIAKIYQIMEENVP